MNQEDFKELLRGKGLKVTSQRLLVLQIMAEHPGEHLTTEQIFDLVRKTNPEIGLATIYRTVQVLVDLHQGTAASAAWGCDLTYDYVRINGDYRT